MIKVLIATSEAAPLAKTGGLADVCGALPQALQQLDCAPTLILPAYRCVLNQIELRNSDEFATIQIPVGNRTVEGKLYQTTLPQTEVPLILVVQDEYFDRPELYSEDGVDYRDNCERFVFFSRAILEAVRVLKIDVDLIHCNDWQTALVPAYLENEYRSAPPFESMATLLTIHNLAYQGRFWHWDMLLTGLDWKLFNWKQLEYYGDLNFLKGGIVFGNSISTVSPRYAEEIQTPELGCGLDGVLRTRTADLHGILNGADYQTWNPSTDGFIAKTFSPQDWQLGKPACKQQLQQRFGLPADTQTPVLGYVGRLVEQKGLELLVEIIQRWAPHKKVQWILLGTGDRQLEARLVELAKAFPHRIAVEVAFSEEIAHQIIAGADLFLMPSRFEPCGLTQFYSMKYGTIPLVHATGGLFDSVTDIRQNADGNGFAFAEFSVEACEQALSDAIDLYRGQPEPWKSLVTNAIQQDWSWTVGAKEYLELYQHTVAQLKQSICV